MSLGHTDPYMKLSAGAERSAHHFYSTSYSASNVGVNAVQKPFALPAQRPTGYTANFRPATFYHNR